jgi:hypothetical protein
MYASCFVGRDMGVSFNWENCPFAFLMGVLAANAQYTTNSLVHMMMSMF